MHFNFLKCERGLTIFVIIKDKSEIKRKIKEACRLSYGVTFELRIIRVQCIFELG